MITVNLTANGTLSVPETTESDWWSTLGFVSRWPVMTNFPSLLFFISPFLHSAFRWLRLRSRLVCFPWCWFRGVLSLEVSVLGSSLGSGPLPDVSARVTSPFPSWWWQIPPCSSPCAERARVWCFGLKSIGSFLSSWKKPDRGFADCNVMVVMVKMRRTPQLYPFCFKCIADTTVSPCTETLGRSDARPELSRLPEHAPVH